jgi:dipeptidyl aminopeptidase/acylaminoacyl peptidase
VRTSTFTLLLLTACGGKVTHPGVVATAPAEGEVLPDSGRVFRSARFAPDGSYIAFHALDDGTKEVVGVMRPDGNEAKVLATTDTPLTSVAWSPDGKTLFFTTSSTVEAVDPVSGTRQKLTDAPSPTDLDVSLDDAVLLWVKNGSTVQSLKRNVAGATPVDETHQGTSPRFDGNGALYGYAYVGFDGTKRPLLRDFLGGRGASGGVTLDLGPLASVSALGRELYVVTSTAGVEQVSQTGERTVLRPGSGFTRVDATPDGKWVLYLEDGKASLFVFRSPL